MRSEIRIGKAEDFDAIVEANPEVQQIFWRLIQRHASIGYEWLVNCGRRDSITRVAHLLCETAERSGIDPTREGMINPFTQQQIADITGQTSVNVNRVFADLERQRLIRREGRHIYSATGANCSAWRASSRAICNRLAAWMTPARRSPDRLRWGMVGAAGIEPATPPV